MKNKNEGKIISDEEYYNKQREEIERENEQWAEGGI